MRASPVSTPITAPWGAFALSLLFLAIAAFTLVASGRIDRAQADQRKYDTSLTGCAMRGGTVARGPFGESYCRFVFGDGGQSCTDTSQCIGGCIYEPEEAYATPLGRVVGVCQRSNAQYGCYAQVVGGRAINSVCAD